MHGMPGVLHNEDLQQDSLLRLLDESDRYRRRRHDITGFGILKQQDKGRFHKLPTAIFFPIAAMSPSNDAVANGNASLSSDERLSATGQITC